MNNTLVSDADVDKALAYLRDSAQGAAKAKAERIYMVEYTKSLKAILMSESDEKTSAAKEMQALADQRYLDHIAALQTAVENEEKLKFLREAASAKISAWQTFNANIRSMKI